MRKLVTIRKIDNILPIDAADNIEQVLVGGWIVVSQKGIHKVGDTVVYFELDSFLPESDARFASFMKFGTRNFNGVSGHKVKTVRLRGVYSQGIIMPIAEFPEIVEIDLEADYSEAIGIVKWEAPEINISAGKFGDTKGNFPWFLQKSDQERLQNSYGRLQYTNKEDKFVGTLKMDGSSITVFCVNDEKFGEPRVGVCSRNLELKCDLDIPYEEQGCFIKGAINSGLFDKVLWLSEIFGDSYAIQGELVGRGIQSGFEKFEDYQVFAYNIYNITDGKFVDYRTFESMAHQVELQAVPVIYPSQQILLKPLNEILDMADGEGLQCKYREGIVYKQVNGTCQFKTISNKYLTKQE